MHDALALVREHAKRVDALTEQVTQLSGQVGFWQGQAQAAQEQVKLLQAPPDEPAPQSRWWRWWR